MSDDPDKIDPALRRWVASRGPSERCTVLVRLRSSVEPEAAREALGEAGAEVRSAGPGLATAVVSAPVIRSIAMMAIVVAIEAPKELKTTMPGTRPGIPIKKGF